MEVAILLYEGFDELDAIGPYETFDYAARYGCDVDTSLVTLAESERVTASHGLRIEPDGTLADADPDLLVVPGGGWNDRSVAGAWTEYERGTVPEAIAEQYDRGVSLASVCTGGMLLSKAGVLEGRPATTHHGALDDLRASGADVRESRVVDDGDILTCGGITSGIDLALHLIERECGGELADSVAEVLEYERRSF